MLELKLIHVNKGDPVCYVQYNLTLVVLNLFLETYKLLLRFLLFPKTEMA